MHRRMLMLVGLLALALWPTDLVAQRRGPGEMAAPTDSVIEAYKSRLNLTDEQAATAIRLILEVQRQKGQEMFETVRGQGREAMMEMRPKMEQLRTETNEQIEGVLEEDRSRNTGRSRPRSESSGKVVSVSVSQAASLSAGISTVLVGPPLAPQLLPHD